MSKKGEGGGWVKRVKGKVGRGGGGGY
jgi:hypothetical protein